MLIAIVSDSYADAMRRSSSLFWRARIDLIAEYEPLLPKYQDDDFIALMDEEQRKEFEEKNAKKPNTWQYHSLMFQEGLVMTGVLCGVVLFELLYVGDLDDQGLQGSAFFCSACCWLSYTTK